MATNYSQLNELQRETIQILLSKGKNFTEIGKAINMDRTTVSKEIRRNSYIKSYHFEAFDKIAIEKARTDCKKLSNPPYICNNCPLRNTCHKHHLYYNSKEAQKHSESVATTSREGVDITPEKVDEVEREIVPLIRDKKQSINQVYINHSDILDFSKTTFYKYVNTNVLSLQNIDLPKKTKYKKRKKKNNVKTQKRDLKVLKGRKYEDFILFTSNHPNMSIVEMDTVIGKRADGKVLLTMFVKETHFMFIFLLNKKNIENVNEKISFLKEQLGITLYKDIFRIILTDNGSEFLAPSYFEYDLVNDKKICNLFYCDPYCSWQKHGVEVNHEYIRRVFPKGTSFNKLNDNIVKRLQDNINAIPRVSLNGDTPYNLMQKKYPDLFKKINCSYIEPDNVDLSVENIKGANHE